MDKVWNFYLSTQVPTLPVSAIFSPHVIPWSVSRIPRLTVHPSESMAWKVVEGRRKRKEERKKGSEGKKEKKTKRDFLKWLSSSPKEQDVKITVTVKAWGRV